jgi:RNA polymerase sigma-70 factor (sigma-E family)
LRRSAYLLCGDWHLADDLAQQTLIKMHDAWPRIARRHQPVSYARKTLLRCWLDERRRPWRRSEERGDDVPEPLDHDADPARRHEHALARDELLDALATVPPRQRAVLVLRFFESLSVEETARALGCSAGTVKSQTARGLTALRVSVDRFPATTTMKEDR